MAVCKRCSLFVFGLGVGAAAGVLLAPKPGKEIRQELFGKQLDVLGEPGTDLFPEEPEGDAGDLKERIEETRARLKAEIEGKQNS